MTIAPRERPILFSAPMVRAILDGTKTQTRRVVRFRDCNDDHSIHRPWLADDGWHDYDDALRCPYGAPGDRLWVRETWAVRRSEPCLPHELDYQDILSPVVRYAADGTERQTRGDRATGIGIYHGRVEVDRPSIHMPRWASRLTLAVTDVRVERLQAITHDDAVAEGIGKDVLRSLGFLEYGDPVSGFSWLWDSINAKRAPWESNPWVWVVSFEKVAA